MSIISMSLCGVPNGGWLKRKKAPSWVFQRIDQYDSFPVTVNNGEKWLGYIVLNNLGRSNERPAIAPGGYSLRVEKQGPSKNGKHPRWGVFLDDYEITISKSAADQWDFFSTFSDCEPFCAMVSKTRTTLVFAIDKSEEESEFVLFRPWR